MFTTHLIAQGHVSSFRIINIITQTKLRHAKASDVFINILEGAVTFSVSIIYLLPWVTVRCLAVIPLVVGRV